MDDDFNDRVDRAAQEGVATGEHTLMPLVEEAIADARREFKDAEAELAAAAKKLADFRDTKPGTHDS